MFEGFATEDVPGEGATIRLRRTGAGPPLLLLHGYPETHAMWHRVAPGLSRDFTVIAADLRGFALPCGHFLAEEAPQATEDALRAFFLEENGGKR